MEQPTVVEISFEVGELRIDRRVLIFEHITIQEDETFCSEVSPEVPVDYGFTIRDIAPFPMGIYYETKEKAEKDLLKRGYSKSINFHRSKALQALIDVYINNK